MVKRSIAYLLGFVFATCMASDFAYGATASGTAKKLPLQQRTISTRSTLDDVTKIAQKRRSTRKVAQRGRTALYPRIRKRVGNSSVLTQNISTVKLVVPDDIADAYPNLRHYMNISGGDGYISLIKSNGVLPDLSLLFTNMKNAGVDVTGIYDKNASTVTMALGGEGEEIVETSEPEAEEIYSSDGTVTNDSSTATEINMVADIDNGCPSGLENPAVLAAMLKLNDIEEGSEESKHHENWTWQYYRTFNATPNNPTQNNCKLIVKDKTGICWTNGGQDARGGMEQDENGDWFYVIKAGEKFHTDKNAERTVIPVIVSCDIPSFYKEEYTGGQLKNWAGTRVGLYIPNGVPNLGQYVNEVYLHVEKDKRLPPLNDMVANVQNPAGQRLGGIYGGNGKKYYDDAGNPVATIVEGDPVGNFGDELHLRFRWVDLPPSAVDSGNGCPNASTTIDAWNAYYAATDDNIDGSKIRYVRGATQKADNSDCAIIFQPNNSDGLCHMARWNSKINGYQTYATANKPSYWNYMDVVVNCNKTTSDVDTTLVIDSNVNGQGLPTRIGASTNEDLPSLIGLLQMVETGYYRSKSSLSPAKFLGIGNQDCAKGSSLGDYKTFVKFPNNTTMYWNADGTSGTRISSAGNETKVYACWDYCIQEPSGNASTCRITHNDCPVPDVANKPDGATVYPGYTTKPGDTFVQLARKTNQTAMKIPKDCVAIVKDTDDLYWMLNADGGRMMVPENENIYRKKYGITGKYTTNPDGSIKSISDDGKDFIPFINGGVGISTETKITTNAQTNVDGLLVGAPWGADGYAMDEMGNTGMLHLPNLKDFVTKINKTANGKRFAGIYSLPEGAGATQTVKRVAISKSTPYWYVTFNAKKYYDECGRPVAKYLSREFMEEETPGLRMYMAWADGEAPDCSTINNGCEAGQVKVTFNCGIGSGTPDYTKCISKEDPVKMPSNTWCSYGGTTDAFDGWQQYPYPRYVNKQKTYSSSEGVQFAWESTLLQPGSTFTYNNNDYLGNNEYAGELVFTAAYKCTDIMNAEYDPSCTGTVENEHCVANECGCKTGFKAWEYGDRADLDPYHRGLVCVDQDAGD